MTLTPLSRRPAAIAAFALILMAPGLAVRASAQTAPAAGPPARKTQSDIVVTARRITTPLTVDGRIDEAVYTQFAPLANLIQQEPEEGAPVSEKTETWIFFDDKNLYVAARCYDSHPEKEVVTEMRRDNVNIFQNESFTIVLDTFRDLRNGFMFQTNALGGVRDQAIVDEQTNESWNTIWDVRASRGDWGWSVEIAVPFKSLRYPGAGPQTWGVNMRRVIKWKNEYAYLTAMPKAFGINNAISRMGEAATLVGVETPAQSKNLELKPYVASSVTTDRTTASPFNNRREVNAGFDFKYGLTRSLILDTTVNTDFAQVEEDQQQVNLTRFSLFFPEKRDFFLEGQGVFSFGGATGTSNNPGEVPVLFFSRQIGLSKGQSVPVLAGARLTGRAGSYQIGAVNVETRDKPEAAAVATNFTAVRVKRDFLQRSNIGIVATRRSPTASATGENLAYGVDANLFLFRNVTGVAYYARTDSPGRSGGQASYRGRFEFAGDRWGYVAEHLLIGPQFAPEIGYVRRKDFRRSFGQVRFSPRPRNARRVRKYSYTLSMDYITDAAITSVQEKELRGRLTAPADNLTQDIYVSPELKTMRVMVKDEDVCLHCGLCAERCPTGAWDMQKSLIQMTYAGPSCRDKHSPVKKAA